MSLTQRHIRRVPGALTLRAKRSEREDDHSPPTNTEIKNGGATSRLSHMPSRLVAHFDEVGIKLLKVEKKGNGSVHII